MLGHVHRKGQKREKDCVLSIENINIRQFHINRDAQRKMSNTFVCVCVCFDFLSFFFAKNARISFIGYFVVIFERNRMICSNSNFMHINNSIRIRIRCYNRDQMNIEYVFVLRTHSRVS